MARVQTDQPDTGQGSGIVEGPPNTDPVDVYPERPYSEAMTDAQRVTLEADGLL